MKKKMKKKKKGKEGIKERPQSHHLHRSRPRKLNSHDEQRISEPPFVVSLDSLLQG